MAVISPAPEVEIPRVNTANAERPRRPWKRYRSRTFYLFILPWLLGFLALTVLPMLYALQLSFTSASGISTNSHWVGLANYIEIFHDPAVMHSLTRTALFTVTVVPLTVAGSLVLALLVNRPLPGIGIFRALFYLPAVVPGVAAALTWKLIFDKNAGPANGILAMFGGNAVDWLQDPAVSYVLLLLMLWGAGGGMLVALAGLQDVPKELHEAAKVDGANRWQIFWRITVPMLSPILLFQVVTGVINALQVVVQPMLLTPSSGDQPPSAASVSPGNSLFMVHVYSQYMDLGRFGYGSALLWVLFIAVLIITLIILRVGNRAVFYNIDPDDATNKG